MNKNEITYMDMVNRLREKIHDCRIEIEALKEEKVTAMFDYGIDGKEYDEWIEEQHQEIYRLHKMINNLQEIYREVR
jgi:nicotinate-nucleotide pyrophosphorylase